MVRGDADRMAVTRATCRRLFRSGPYRSVARSLILLQPAHTHGWNPGIIHSITRGASVLV
jgi:hypothetical protein